MSDNSKENEIRYKDSDLEIEDLINDYISDSEDKSVDSKKQEISIKKKKTTKRKPINYQKFLEKKRLLNYIIFGSKLIVALIILVFVCLCSGCQSPQERNGVSLLPQNRPSIGRDAVRSNSNMGMSF